VSAVLAISCYASLAPISKKLQLANVPSFAFMGITQSLLAALAFTALIITKKNFSINTLDRTAWTSLVTFSTVNFVGFTLYLYAITKMPVSEYQLFGLLTPLIGAIIAFFLLGEPFKLRYFIGGIFVAIGLFIALKDWSKSF